MQIELYWASGSPFSWRVLLALEAKAIPYDSRLIEFSKRQHQSPEFLAINPRGKVPALRDGEVTLGESIAILAYLERKYEGRPLFGRTPAETGRIWQRVMETACELDGPTDAFILPIYFGQVEAKRAELDALVPGLETQLGRLERELTTGSHLVGDDLSAADFVVYPLIKSIVRAASKPAAAGVAPQLADLSGGYPQVAAWMARIESLPYYDKTYPPHWR